jgi:glycosyltransferase involved in cell wall biosynthesis
MSLARAVLVAQGSAAEELCEDGAALAVEAHAEALATKLRALIDDPALRARLGAQASQTVRTRYGYRVMAAAYEQLYDRLLA